MKQTNQLVIHGDLEPLRTSGARNMLVYDPEEHDVYLFSGIGSGVPEPVWHNRMLAISVPDDAIGASLVDVLDNLEGEFEELQETYLGAKVDHNYNRYGQWEEYAYAIVEDIEDYIRENVSQFWDAGDWIFGADTPSSILKEIKDVGKDKWVENIIADAHLDNVHLNKDEVTKLVDGLLKEESSFFDI